MPGARTHKFEDLIGRSFHRTRDMLFRPFSFKKWLRLILITFLAGAYGYSGMGSGSSSSPSSSSTSSSSGGTPGAGVSGAVKDPAPTSAGSSWKDRVGGISARVINWAKEHKAWLAGATAALSPILVLFLWLRARFEFVWFNAVRENTSDISGAFDQFARPGNSLFRFYLLLLVLTLLYLAGMSAWGWSAVKSLTRSEGIWSTLRPFIPIVLALLSTGIAGFFFFFFLDHCVVAVMGTDNARFGESFRKSLGILRARKLDFLIYLLIWIGLRVVAGVLMFIATLAVAIALLLAGAVVFGGLYLVVFKALAAKWVFFILAALAGVPFGIVSILLLYSIQLPAAAFFRAFSLHFLSSLDAGCAPLSLDPDPAA